MIEEMLTVMSLGKMTIFSIEDATMFELLFRRLAESFQVEYLQGTGKGVCSLKVNGQLIQLLDIVKQAGEEKEERDTILPAIFYITEHFREDIDLELCAAQIHLSVSRFSVLFKNFSGLSFGRYERNFRLNGAAGAIRSGATLKEAAAEWDFCDKSHLARLLKEL
jgi:two-component system response regulator YesN